MPTVTERLEIIRRDLGLLPDRFHDLTLGQLAMVAVQGRVTGIKWTRGEISRIIEEGDGDAALEVLKYLDERGPRVVDWADDSDLEEDGQAEERFAEVR